MNEDVNEITVDKDGKPSRMNQPYQQLRVLKDIYKGKGIEVLNIYGDLKDGTHSDGRVSNSSSKSLKYLLEIVRKVIENLNMKVSLHNIVSFMRMKMLLMS